MTQLPPQGPTSNTIRVGIEAAAYVFERDKHPVHGRGREEMYWSPLKGLKRTLWLSSENPMTSCQPAHAAQDSPGHWMTWPDRYVGKLPTHNHYTPETIHPRHSGGSQASSGGPETRDQERELQRGGPGPGRPLQGLGFLGRLRSRDLFFPCTSTSRPKPSTAEMSPAAHTEVPSEKKNQEPFRRCVRSENGQAGGVVEVF